MFLAVRIGSKPPVDSRRAYAPLTGKKTDVENFDFQAQEVVWKLGVDSIIMEFHKDLLSE